MNSFEKSCIGLNELGKLLKTVSVIMFLSSLCEALTCDHLQYQYYHKQAKQCMDCDVCVIGEGKIKFTNGMDLKFGPHGATICLPCRTCPKGTFSDRRSHHCDPCTNCTAKNLLEKRSCIHSHDAICGEKISPREKNEIPSNTRKHQRRKRYVTGKEKQSMGFVIGIVVIIILVLLCFLFVLYLRITRKRRQQSETTATGQERMPLNQDPTTDRSNESASQQDVEDVGQNSPSPSPSLSTISEEHGLINTSSDTLQYSLEKDKRKAQTPKEKQKCSNFWYHGNNKERAPLLPKRKRYSSCTVDYGTKSKNIGYDNPVLPPTHTAIPRPQTTAQSMTRRKSFPMSCPESSLVERDNSYDLDSVPSEKFCSYFSKLTVTNNIFQVVAQDNGLEDEKLNQIYMNFINKGIREVAYRVAVELGKMKVTKEKIYESLEKHQYIDVLINLQVYDLRTNLNKYF